MNDVLQIELTSFVGREDQIAALIPLLASSRMLTLTGPGGSGKTRLALELLRRGPPAPGEAAVVELASLDDAALIPQKVAAAFAVREELRGGDPAALVDLLRARSALLVLDNCEHLIDACARLADTLLRGCPGIRILATSREALGVKGERAWPVPALAVPAPDATPEELESAEAVRLFVERARDTAAAFRVTGKNAPAIAEICRRLDGIPLAIELAAARLKVLTPDQIRDRLDDAFRLLVSSGRTAIPRHRTLRAAIDWSHDLLHADARALFRRLAVFRDGFSLEAVEAVGRGAGETWDTLDVLERLVDQSLVVVREHGGEARYTLLETVRQYALERLEESGEGEAVRSRHASFITSLVAEAEPQLTRPARREWVDRLDLDLENIREALRWSLSGDPSLHVRLVGLLWWYWFSTRHWSEARQWIERALELPAAAEPGRARAQVLFAAGALASLQTRTEASGTWLREAIDIAVRLGDTHLEACANNYLGLCLSQSGDPAGIPHARRALELYTSTNDLYGLRLCYLILGTAAMAAGNSGESARLNGMGVEVARRFGQDRELGIALQNLATSRIAQGDMREAEALLIESLGALRRDPSYLFIARNLDLLAETLGARGEVLVAARCIGAAAAIRGIVGARAFKLDDDRLQALIPKLRAAAGDEAFDKAWREGSGVPAEAMIDELLHGAAPLAAGQPARLVPTRGRDDGLDSGDKEVAAAAPAAERPAGGADLEVRALGPLEVVVLGRPVPPEAWPYAKPKEMLLYLACHPDGRTRDQIGAALWPAATAAQAKNSFHVTLHHLRKVIGQPGWIAVDGGRYRIARDVRFRFDADRFEREARSALRGAPGDGGTGRVRTILSLWRGDLFEGDTAGAWHEDLHDRLRQLRIDLSLQLGRALEAEGDTHGALEIYEDVAVHDDLNEEAHRGLMAGWARTGNRSRALQHYARVAGLLRDVLDAEPEPETMQLYERIRTAAPD